MIYEETVEMNNQQDYSDWLGEYREDDKVHSQTQGKDDTIQRYLRDLFEKA